LAEKAAASGAPVFMRSSLYLSMPVTTNATAA
jgi:hypothetical protein